MIPIEEYRTENREIKDICEIISLAVNDFSMMQNHITDELLHRFFDRVNQHLRHEDKAIYGDLLAKHTSQANKYADFFLENTRELKRINKQFKKRWSKITHTQEQHQEFTDDINSIFKLTCDRIEFEEKKIFPMFIQD